MNDGWTSVNPLPGMNPDELLATPAGGGKLVILFHTVQKKNEYKSTLENRPVFEERIHITKIVPGDNKLVIDRPLREVDKQEFAMEWTHWERTRENRMPGIPIEHWHSINDTQKAEFKALKIYTVEQFANLPDSAAEKIMGFYELRQKAKVFLEAGKDAELIARIKKDSEEKVNKLEAQLMQMMAEMEEMKKAQPARETTAKRS